MSAHSLQPPVSIRPSHIPSQETSLYLLPKASPHSATDYTINNAITDTIVFTVTGKKYGSGSGREFRDDSGLPLFELRRVAVLSRWPWRVRLPGDEEKDLGRVYVRSPSMRIKLDMMWNCVASGDRKGEGGEMVRLEVRQTTALYMFDVLVGDGDGEEKKKVADIRESVERNKSVGYWPRGPCNHVPPKRVLDIRVAGRLDLSIAALVAVFISDMHFGDQLET